MKKNIAISYVFLLFQIIVPCAFSHDFSGSFSFDYRHYFHNSLITGASDNCASLSFKPQYSYTWDNGSRIVVEPFFRVDTENYQSVESDIHQMDWFYVDDAWSLRFGIGKVFWGATEFVHLADIINQTDLRHNPNGEEKLGQPMVNFNYYQENWALECYLLPGFRERAFSEIMGRLNPSMAIDSDSAEYESDDKEKHIDIALRLNLSVNNLDVGIYHFIGTSREPAIVPRFDELMQLKLVPYYSQIEQTGLDLQWVLGTWIAKMEMIYRAGSGEDFWASVGGLEYTVFNIVNSAMDLTLIGEYSHDQRDWRATHAFQNDVVMGFRLSLNDMATTEILSGIAYDITFKSKVVSVEFSRRLYKGLSIKFESKHFIDLGEQDLLYNYRNDSYIQACLIYHF